MAIRVYDVRGNRVRTIVDGHRGAGNHRVHWDGTDDLGIDSSSGIYFYRLESSDGVKTRRFVLVR